MEPKKKPRRGIYLLPNLFTTAALFAGFYAIVAAMNSRFEAAAIAVFVAMVLDGLDGRVARMTNTQSDFGAEYDSLADMVSFGVAPALVMYQWSLIGMGKLGWVAAFIYAAAAALRLARFNTQIAVVDKRFFHGLPSPSAAAIVTGFVWVMHDYSVSGASVQWLAWVITVGAGLLMVSTVRYYSFKSMGFAGKVPFVTLLVVVLVFVSLTLYPAEVLFAVFAGYTLSGLLTTVLLLRRRRHMHEAARQDEEPTAE